jgi:hypothetical protein
MSYDHWKTTDPVDMELGTESQDRCRNCEKSVDLDPDQVLCEDCLFSAMPPAEVARKWAVGNN